MTTTIDWYGMLRRLLYSRRSRRVKLAEVLYYRVCRHQLLGRYLRKARRERRWCDVG